MRKIKFRGKASHDSPYCKKGEWAYGGFVSTIDGICYIVKAERAVFKNKMIVEFSSVEVDPETVGQFTGFKDKNKLEVYGGDVVWVDDDRLESKGFRAVIEWCNSSLCWYWTRLDIPHGCSLHTADSLRMTIVGNIHEEGD